MRKNFVITNFRIFVWQFASLSASRVKIKQGIFPCFLKIPVCSCTHAPAPPLARAPGPAGLLADTVLVASRGSRPGRQHELELAARGGARRSACAAGARTHPAPRCQATQLLRHRAACTTGAAPPAFSARRCCISVRRSQRRVPRGLSSPALPPGQPVRSGSPRTSAARSPTWWLNAAGSGGRRRC